MIGNGNFEGAKKQITDFTIDCILSKDNQAIDRRTSSLQQPMTLNKVLNNNPWIPISPLAHFFTPSALQKKFSLPNLFSNCPPPIGSNFIQNLIKATEQSHFYALSSSVSSLNLQKSNYTYSLEDRHLKALQLKSNSVYEKLSCDTQILINDEVEHLKSNSPTSVLSDGENKCTTCFKIFESNELLEVSWTEFYHQDMNYI